MRFWRLASFSSAALVFFSLAFENVVEREKSSPWPFGGLARRAVAPQNFVFLKMASVKSEFARSAPFSSAPVKFAPIARAKRRSASWRLAPSKFAPMRSDPERSASKPRHPEKSARFRLASRKLREREVGAREVDALGLHLGQVGAREGRADEAVGLQVGPPEDGLRQVGALEVGLLEARRAQVHLGQLGLGEADVGAAGVEEHRPAQVRLAEPRAVEAGGREVGLDGGDELHVGVGELGALAVGGVQATPGAGSRR